MGGNTKEPAATAVVIDSDRLRRQQTKALLERQGIAVLGLSTAVERAAQVAELHACDLLIVGLGGEVEAGTAYSVLRKAHRRSPELVTIALVENDDPARVDAALAAGSFAAVDQTTSMREVARLALEALAERRETRERDAGCPSRSWLTRREIEILRLVAEGRSNREVAELLWVTDQTVKFHLANTYRKLGVRNRAEASKWAFTRGLVRPAVHGGTYIVIREPFGQTSTQVKGDAVAVTP